jgi:hypothetical protein
VPAAVGGGVGECMGRMPVSRECRETWPCGTGRWVQDTATGGDAGNSFLKDLFFAATISAMPEKVRRRCSVASLTRAGYGLAIANALPARYAAHAAAREMALRR